MSGEPQKLWAVVELFGHAKIAGAVSEQTFGGAAMVRVDVPAVTVQETRWVDAPEGGSKRVQSERAIAAHTRSFGPGAIYSINWCDEPTARLAAQSIQHEPMSPYSVREALRNMPPEHQARLLPAAPDDLFREDD